MLTTRFILSFLGFCRASWMIRKQEGCAYQVNLTIITFRSYPLHCCWSKEDAYNSCSPCTSTTIFPKSINLVNITLLPNTSDATLTTNVPAVNSSIPEIKLQFQVSRESKKAVCVIESVKNYDRSRNKSKWFYGDSCYAKLCVTSTLYCSTTTTQVTPSVTRTNTNQTRNTTAPKKKTQIRTMTTECFVLYTMMVVSYIVAMITITVEIVMCCKMYERTKKFPWCEVYLDGKVATDTLKAENVSSTEGESTTMTSERINNLSQSDCSLTCGSEDQDQKVG